MSQQVEIGILCQFGHRGFGFIEIPRPGGQSQRIYCHVAGFRKPEAGGSEVIFLPPGEIDPAGVVVSQLCLLAGERVPVVFIPGRNGKGPVATNWCLASALADAELTVVHRLTEVARARQEEITRLKGLLDRQIVESEDLLRLTPETLEEAKARGWTVRQEGKQVVMVTTGPDGKTIARNFHRKATKAAASNASPFKLRQTG